MVAKFRIIGSDGTKLTEDTVVTAELLPSPSRRMAIVR